MYGYMYGGKGDTIVPMARRATRAAAAADREAAGETLGRAGSCTRSLGEARADSAY